MQLVNELIKGLLPEEETKKTIGVFAGGFKPPTKGHFEVLKQALEENPEIDEMLVFVGKKERDGITQDESLKVWEIYGKYLPFKVKFVKATTSPIRLIYNTAKDNPEDEVVWVIGAREGNEEDFKDLASRTKGMSKYPNLELRTVITTGGTSTTSGTAARNALQVSKEKFDRFIPDFLSDQEKQDIYVMLTNKIQEKKDPKTGTGKKPKGSSRRLYTDEDPKDTVSVKFSTRQDIVDTLNKKSFKAKSHARQSQIINLIHQRVRAAYGRAKDPAVKKRLKTALDYAEQRKEASKKKTQRLKNQKNENVAPNHDGKAAPFGSGYKKINENASYTQNIDVKREIADLTKHMLKIGLNIQPLPKLVLKHGDSENAREFLGKTAYYDPHTQTIVLYTEGRHPKDIVRSYSHEMIHHIQNLENRLGDIQGTNTMEDDHLNQIEQEANLMGTMTFRNWTDSLNENLTKSSNYIYHWTSYSACKKIIESNKLKSNKSNQFFNYDESRDLPEYKNVVFFTVEDERWADEETSNQCVLVVDKSKLSKDYKVISYDDPYEETIVYTNDPSIPILPYLKGVLLMNTLQKSAVKKMVEFLESKGIPYEINDNLEREVKAKKAKLPSLKKELINRLKLKYPNGFIGYLNSPLMPYQTPEYFKNNPTYGYPTITINKPGEYGEKNKLQIQFKIKPQNLEKYINWFVYSPDSIEDLINIDNYEGEGLKLKGDIPIDINFLQEANLKSTMTFRNWTDSLNENVKVDQVDQLEFLLNKWTAYSGQYDLLPEIARLAKNLGVNNGPSVVYRAVPGLNEYPYTKQEIIDYDKEQEIVSTSATKEQAEEFITSEADWAYILEYKPHIIVNFDEFEKKYSWTGNWGEGEILIDVSKSKLIKIKSYTLNEATNKDPFGVNAYAMELARLREEETEYQIYCDMDGVLADFERGYEELTGINPSSDSRPEGKEFWDPVSKAGVKFWAGLKWMPDGQELWNYIKPHTPKLLSAPTREESSRIGKYVWVKHKIPGTKLILRYANKKKELATPTSILIDDRKSNIDSWEAAGGIGILHTSTASTIEKLKELGL